MGIIRNLCTFLLKEGDVCIGIAPQFSRFVSEVELQKAIYKPFYLNKKKNYKFEVDEFLSFLKENSTNNIKVIYIDNPNNPTGQILDIKDIEKILLIAKQNNIYVLIDEAYGDYMDLSNYSVNLINEYDNLIVFKSASKLYGLPSDRVGYVIGSKELIEIYDKVLLPFPFSEDAMNHFIKVLENRFEIQKTLKEIRNLKEYFLSTILNGNILNTSPMTPIFTIYSEKYDNLQNELLKNKLLVESCSFFEGLNGQYVRIRVSKEKEKIVNILNEVL